jgi:hypothetical protein
MPTTMPTLTTSDFITRERLQGALVFLSRLPPSTRVTFPNGSTRTLGELFEGRSIGELLDEYEPEDDQDNGRVVLQWAYNRGYRESGGPASQPEKASVWPYVLGAGAVVGLLVYFARK